MLELKIRIAEALKVAADHAGLTEDEFLAFMGGEMDELFSDTSTEDERIDAFLDVHPDLSALRVVNPAILLDMANTAWCASSKEEKRRHDIANYIFGFVKNAVTLEEVKDAFGLN